MSWQLPVSLLEWFLSSRKDTVVKNNIKTPKSVRQHFPLSWTESSQSKLTDQYNSHWCWVQERCSGTTDLAFVCQGRTGMGWILHSHCFRHHSLGNESFTAETTDTRSDPRKKKKKKLFCEWLQLWNESLLLSWVSWGWVMSAATRKECFVICSLSQKIQFHPPY